MLLTARLLSSLISIQYKTIEGISPVHLTECIIISSSINDRFISSDQDSLKRINSVHSTEFGSQLSLSSIINL